VIEAKTNDSFILLEEHFFVPFYCTKKLMKLVLEFFTEP
jgi:hypothetical protein